MCDGDTHNHTLAQPRRWAFDVRNFDKRLGRCIVAVCLGIRMMIRVCCYLESAFAECYGRQGNLVNNCIRTQNGMRWSGEIATYRVLCVVE